MKATRNYLGTPEEKQAQALEDIHEHLGPERFLELTNTFRSLICQGHWMVKDGLEEVCSMFVGIEGFPVQAWYQSILDDIQKNGTFEEGEKCDLGLSDQDIRPREET